MVSRGAIIVGTSNRSPEELSNSSISGESDEVEEKKPTSIHELFTERCEIYHVKSETDYRNELPLGELHYIHPVTSENKQQFDTIFSKLMEPGTMISSKFLEIYNRKILIPVSNGTTARFHFRELCMEPFGSADYLKICNEYSEVFIDEIPRLSIHMKNEARRFLSFIDAAYETRTNVYCTADSGIDDIFLMLPRDDDEYQPDQMHLEMIGEIAYDLKLAGLDFKSLNLISGENEIFSFKRAISRLKEMQSEFYQKTEHRKQHFVPFTGSLAEKMNAEDKRRWREKQRLRQQAIDQETSLNSEESTEESWNFPAGRANYKDTDWGDEASYNSIGRDTSNIINKSKNIDQRQKQAPKFGQQHFWGFGWWEHVKNKLKKKNKK